MISAATIVAIELGCKLVDFEDAVHASIEVNRIEVERIAEEICFLNVDPRSCDPEAADTKISRAMQPPRKHVIVTSVKILSIAVQLTKTHSWQYWLLAVGNPVFLELPGVVSRSKARKKSIVLDQYLLFKLVTNVPVH